jgi:hypothetical protein
MINIAFNNIKTTRPKTGSATKGDQGMPIPSHIFVIAKRCLEDPDTEVEECPEDMIDIIAFILPNDDDNVNCEVLHYFNN